MLKSVVCVCGCGINVCVEGGLLTYALVAALLYDTSNTFISVDENKRTRKKGGTSGSRLPSWAQIFDVVVDDL